MHLPRAYHAPQHFVVTRKGGRAWVLYPVYLTAAPRVIVGSLAQR
jgi:hypothetical protein